MTLIWLSPGLPADRSAIASSLGPAVDISSAAVPPEGTSVAVATVFERALLDRLAMVPAAGTLLVLKPPGTATPGDLPPASGPWSVLEAADVNEVVFAIQGQLTASPTPWPASDPNAGSGGWLLPPAGAPTGELPAAEAAGFAAAGAGSTPRTRRRTWLASGGIVAAAALAAIVVLATQGGATNASANGRGGPGFGGPGSLGQAAPGTGSTTQPPTGTGGTGSSESGSSQSGSSPTGTDRAAERQAFLDCLQKNGVDTSTFSSGQRPRLDPSDPTMASALQACAALLPRRGGGMRPGAGAPGMPGGPFAPDGGQPPAGIGGTSPDTTPGRTT